MVGARLVWVDRKFELRDFDQTRAGGGGGCLSCLCGGGGLGNIAIGNVKVQKTKIHKVHIILSLLLYFPLILTK